MSGDSVDGPFAIEDVTIDAAFAHLTLILTELFRPRL